MNRALWTLAPLAFTFGLSTLPTKSRGQTPPDLTQRLEAIEKSVNAKREELHIPGAALVIVQDDKIIYRKGFGVRDVEKKLPVTPDTLFAIGSSTKAFTGMTVMMSVDDGKLALTDSPKKYLYYFKLQDPEADGKITIADLLCHKSGLARTDLCWYAGGSKITTREVIEVAGQAKPTAKLGEKFQYQNVMFVTAGEIVATVQEKPWQAFVHDRIFKPLGMKSSNLSIRQMQRAKDYALGYVYDDKKKTHTQLPMRLLDRVAPAGAINSNLNDMAQWLRLMLGGGAFEGKRLVSESSFAELTKPHMKMSPQAGYGFGWMLSKWKGKQVVEHGGNIDGFNAEVALLPEKRLGFVLLTNVSASPLGAHTMSVVWEQLAGEGKSEPEPKPAVANANAKPEVESSKEVGTYHLKEAKMDIAVTFEEGKLMAFPSGQMKLPLKFVSGRKYEIGSPAPPNIFLTFRPSAENPNETEMLLEQSGAKLVGKKKGGGSEFKAPLTVEELYGKMVAALGGEANLRKRTSLVLKQDLMFNNDGLTGKHVLYHQAPNRLCEQLEMIALTKKIGTLRDFFDGKEGGSEVSFQGNSKKEGEALENAANSAAFYPELDWKTLYKSVAITGVEKVGDEECYVVVRTPDKGRPIKDYVSTKTFLTRKREEPDNGTTTFTEYRAVEGVQVPFAGERELPGVGKLTFKVREAKFNVRISDSEFKPRKK